VHDVIAHPFFADVDFDLLQKKEYEVPYKPEEEQMTLKESELKQM
jgi:hypothetical protein